VCDVQYFNPKLKYRALGRHVYSRYPKVYALGRFLARVWTELDADRGHVPAVAHGAASVDHAEPDDGALQCGIVGELGRMAGQSRVRVDVLERLEQLENKPRKTTRPSKKSRRPVEAIANDFASFNFDSARL